jgi:hypothetical protein
MKRSIAPKDLSRFFPDPVPKSKHPQPADWPSEEDKNRMIRGYGRVLTWDEYSFRAARFTTDASELAYDEQGRLGRHK